MLKREVRRDNQSKYAIGHKQLPHFTPKNTILRGYRRKEFSWKISRKHFCVPRNRRMKKTRIFQRFRSSGER